MNIPTWSKWVIFVVVFITTIAIPALVLEGPAEAWGASEPSLATALGALRAGLWPDVSSAPVISQRPSG